MLQTLLSAVTATGAGTALPVAGAEEATFLITSTGNMEARVSFEASLDNVTWFKFQGRPSAGGGATDTAWSPGRYHFETRGIAYLRPNITEYAAGSGAITVQGYVAGNLSGTLLANAARTATVSSPDQTNHSGSAVRVRIVSSSPVGAPSVVFTIEGKDAGGNYYTLLASAAVTTATTTTLLVAPWTTAAANARAVDFLPVTWRVTATHGNADSLTYGVYFDTDS